MKKVWDRGVAKKTDSKINQTVEDYTVGVDYLLDLELLPYDIKGTVAHAKMLHKIKILNSKELSILSKGLNEILSLWKVGKFKIDKSQEDGHTAIEAYLTEHCGIVGKKCTLVVRGTTKPWLRRVFSVKKNFWKLKIKLKI